jgi:[ribosomal protein S5]-alanine N-acetyltransferase
MKIFVETERIVLRHIVEGDANDLFYLDSDPEVVRYVGNVPLEKYEQAVKTIEGIHEQYNKYGIARWAMIEKSSNSFLGWAGLKYITDTVNGKSNYYDLGYRLAKAYWGKGYATEAAKAVLEYGFNIMHLPTIYAIADCENDKSHHVLEKSGLQFVNEFDLKSRPHKWYYIDSADSQNKV